MQPTRKKAIWCCGAAGLLVLAVSSAVLGEPYFRIDTETQWQTALGGGGGGGRVLEFPAAEWPAYMTHWHNNLVEGAAYPSNEFLPAQLYVWGGGGGGGLNPEDAGLVMVWGGPTTPLGSYSSAWKYDYQVDPDLTNCTITVTVTAPQFDPMGNQINAVSFGIQDIVGNIRSWQWAVGPAGAPIPWNVPTTITINTALWGVAAATPVATGFANNPFFNIVMSQFFIVDENANWVGGPMPVPPPGQLMPGMWNYWHNLMVTQNPQPKWPDPLKWSQPPVEWMPGLEPPVFLGWDQRSGYNNPPIVADDWLCMDDRPVTDIHWWGSFIGWDQPVPPPLPAGFHIGIWTDVPAGPSFSHPDKLVWETYCTNFAWNFAGYDHDPRGLVQNEACFQFNQRLKEHEWFYQDPGPDGQRVYWLSIAAIYDLSPQYPWGWKTRPQFYNDDAVRIMQVFPGWPPIVGSQWVQGEPIQYPAGTSWDVAFELTTTEPNTKWIQAPDLTVNGIDIRVDGNDGQPRVLADDFLCTKPGLVTDVHLWGSWFYDVHGAITNIHLSIHSDDPVGPGGSDPNNTYSKPDLLLWQGDFQQFREALYAQVPDPGEWWWDPLTGMLMPGGDKQVWKIDIDIPESLAFHQEGTATDPIIYWLDVHVDAVDGQFGWKTREWPAHYNDDAVFADAAMLWNELRYPPGHPYHDLQDNSIDMAFSITFKPDPEPELDFGDAPDQPYPTLLVNDGARHVIVPGVFLGASIDAEADGQQDPNALGDDTAGIDDEDGVIPTSPITPGQVATVDVTASVAGVLYAWIDFNNDGSWAELGDQIFAGQGLNAGLNNLSFNVPNTASGGVTTFARFRFTTSSMVILGYTGQASDGEVEDYTAFIEEVGEHELGDAPDSTNTFGALMTAYPPGGPMGVQANFPTVYVAGSPPWGPIHRQPLAVAWLGPQVSRENEADVGPDEDGINNIIPPADTPDLDRWDDGVIFPLVLPHCKPATFQYIVNVVAVTGSPLYVNAWFDWNRDGDWDDALPCSLALTPEWAVQNQQILVPGPGQYVITTPQFLPWHPAQPLHPLPIWMRITISEQQWQPGGGVGDGGSGPPQGYEFGETEDYYFEPQLPPSPVILAVASVATHGAGPGTPVPLPIVNPPVPPASNIEPRVVVVQAKPNVWLEVTFDKPMDPGPQSVTSNPAIAGITATGNGSPVVKVTFPMGLADEVCYRISLAGSVATDGGVADASANFCVCYNEGDINRVPPVSAADKLIVTSVTNWGKTVPGTAADPQADANRDGTVSAADKLIVTSVTNWGHSPAPCPP